ncbi:YbaB/EbfC family nucleoid-associated protein [Actinoallomurus sp. NPDC052308]|uniref:YbaB/EbfC family nucleoid-associated protein n=1 Tax=Actinoallomurus sp. NPDC052308 TaxID=3155530 RepID=UPI00343677E1
MDERILAQAVEDATAQRFAGTDGHRTVTVTVNGAGKVVELRVIAQDPRRLPAGVFAGGVMQAFARAREAAAEDGSVVRALREQGVDVATPRGITA